MTRAALVPSLVLGAMLLGSCTSASTVTVTSTDVVQASSSTAAPGNSDAPAASVPPASAPASSPSTSSSSNASSTSRSSSTSSTSRSSSATSSTAPPADCARRTLDSLTPAQRIGQLLMVGVPVDELTATAIPTVPTVLAGTPVGGVFLSGKTTADSATVLAGVQAIQRSVVRSSGVRAQIAVDQEGGYVQSLRGSDFPAIPAAVQQGELGPAELAAATSDFAGRLVRAGITLDLAPVADVVPPGTAAENPPIGAQDRQFGSEPAAVSGSITTVIRAMRGAKLGTTAKHFPGLGRVTANTDTSADAVDDLTTAADHSLDPFRAAIGAGTTAVMISNARYPQLDPDHLAVFSRKIITGLLRTGLHFSGLVVSDDVGGAVAVSSVPPGRRAVDFVTAGGDLVLTVQPTDLAPMTAALTAASKGSAEFRARVDDAALHVLRSKQSVGLLTCG